MIQYQPIGLIHSPFTEPRAMPIQPPGAQGIAGTVEIFPAYAEGLCDLEGFSHIILLTHLHRAEGYSLKVRPFLDETLRGVFATRSPRRPNPIGLSVVRLEEVAGRFLQITGVDLVDGTPLLDIKPYVPDFEDVTEVRLGWLTGKAWRVKEVTS